MLSIYWYCLLAIIGVGITAFTIYKNRDIKLSTFLVFFLFATCVTWIGEFIVLGLFDSYFYKTGRHICKPLGPKHSRSAHT